MGTGRMVFGRRLGPAEFWASVDESEERMRRSVPRRALGVADWTGPVMIGEWAYEHPEVALIFGEPEDGYVVRCGSGASSATRAEEVVIPIDDVPVTFVVWRDGEVERAIAEGVEIEARGHPVRALRLETVTDLEPFIAGHRAWIRRLRAERGIDEQGL